MSEAEKGHLNSDCDLTLDEFQGIRKFQSYVEIVCI